MDLKRTLTLCILILFILTAVPLLAGEDGAVPTDGTGLGPFVSMSVPVVLSFDPSPVEVVTYKGYSWYEHPEGSLSSVPGEPALPVFYHDVIVHPHAVDIRFELLFAHAAVFPVQAPVMGVPEPVPYSEPKELEPSAPTKPVIEPVTFMGSGLVRGVNLATIRFDPMLLTGSGQLLVNDEIEGRLSFMVRSDKLHETEMPHFRRTSVFKEMLVEGTLNPEDLQRFGAMRSPAPFASLPDDDVQYVIITDKTKTGTAFTPLSDWKTQKGIPSRIVDTSMIYANYTGTDNAEKVRKFIIDAKNIWGTEFVLIGGDVAVVPVRKVYNSANGYSATDPTDLYYSDLDGTWNADGDSTWGETSDGVDLKPDVIVGRAPVQSIAETKTFVTKTLTYEKEPPMGYLDNATLAGEYLDSYTNSSKGLDNIKKNLLTSNYRSTSLYDKSNGVFGNLNKPNFMASVNKGASLVFHAGHSNWNIMSVGTASNSDLYNGDVKNYNGGYKIGVLSSVGCIANKFDQDDCIGELHVKEEDGGTVAFIGNTNYGWYSPGNPGGGPSDVFQYRMAYELFKNGKNRVGTHFAEGKKYYAGSSNSYNSYRWIEMCLNLIGDPEAFARTAEPTLPNLTIPDRIGLDTSEIDIVVRDMEGNPIKGAIICLEQGGKRTSNRTDAQGRSNLDIPIVGKSYLNITVTGQNLLPYMTNLTLDTILPMIIFNGPYSASTGDTLNLNCTLFDDFGISKALVEHYTNTSIKNVTGTIELSDQAGFWTGNITALWNSTETLFIRVAARDGSGNWNRTGWMGLPVADDDPPYLVSDLTSIDARTGDPHEIKVVAGDNIALSEVALKIGWSGEAPFWTGRMSGSGPLTYSHTVQVPSDRDGELTYEISIEDANGNKNSTLPRHIYVSDDDAPVFLEDLSDDLGTTSDVVSLKVRVKDNIDIYDVKVDYWSPGKGYIGSGTLVNTDGDVWEHTFTAPTDLIGTIEHRFSVRDLSGNTNLSRTGSTSISDDDVPMTILDQVPSIVRTGDELIVRAIVLDNVMVSSVILNVRYGSLRTDSVAMVRENGSRYVAVVKVPVSGVGELGLRIEGQDTSGNRNASFELRTIIEDAEPPVVTSIRTQSSVMAGTKMDIVLEARDNVGLASGVVTWYISGDGYRRDVEMERNGGIFTARIEIGREAYGYIYWTAVINDISGNSVTTKKVEVRIIPPTSVPGPVDDVPDVPKVPVRGEDLDNDGMDDLWEHMNGLDLKSDDSGEDPDGDGFTNIEEFKKGTAPKDALHYPVDTTVQKGTPGERDVSYIIMITGGALLLLLGFIASLLFFKRV